MKPFIKWVGGKRKLLPQLRDKLPASFGTYYEPFLGGGAMLLDLAPERAVANDSNKSLVNLYRQVAGDAGALMARMDALAARYEACGGPDGKKAFYLARRDEYNDRLRRDRLDAHTAALLAFLNKTCFNGVYRCNRAGDFNVPWGRREHAKLYDFQELHGAARLLRRTDILCGDFEEACAGAKAGDFAFLDPPYWDTFNVYQASGFPEADHLRVAALFRELDRRGIQAMLTNSDTDFVREAYAGYRIDRILVQHAVNRDGAGRGAAELVVRNY